MVVQHAGRDLQDDLGEDRHHVGNQDADLVQTNQPGLVPPFIDLIDMICDSVEILKSLDFDGIIRNFLPDEERISPLIIFS